MWFVISLIWMKHESIFHVQRYVGLGEYIVVDVNIVEPLCHHSWLQFCLESLVNILMWTLLDAVAIFLTVTYHQTMSTGLLVTECFFFYGFSVKRKVKPTCLHSAATSKNAIGSYESLNFQILPGLWEPWLPWLYNREVYQALCIKSVKLDPFRFLCKIFEI